MNKKQLLDWAVKAGAWPELSQTKDQDIAFLWKFASLVAAYERGQCALAADTQWICDPQISGGEAIRKRDNEQSK